MPDCEKRLLGLREELRRLKLDSLFVTNETNVSYLSGFECEDSFLLFAKDRNYFIADPRFIEDARTSIKGFEIEMIRSTTYETVMRLVRKNGLKRMGFESMNLPFEVYRRLKALTSPVRLVAVKELVELKRSVKDLLEIALIRKSVSFAKLVLNKTLSLVKPGVSENFLSNMVEREFIKKGARSSFPPIVASDANSSRPHARATDSVISKDGFVMIDIGCCLNGYNSDLTRMVFFGRVKDKVRRIYDIVRRAQEKALNEIRPGNKASLVDLAARRYIQKEGFGKFFLHSLGHGVGLEVHERPAISKTSTDVLRRGMVFTVEPAIYIEKLGGVRVEDMVLVTEKGCEVLTA